MTLSPTNRLDSPPSGSISPLPADERVHTPQDMHLQPVTNTHLPLLISKLEEMQIKFSALGDLATRAAKKLSTSAEKLQDLAARIKNLQLISLEKGGDESEDEELAAIADNTSAIGLAQLEEEGAKLRNEREKLMKNIEQINDVMDNLVADFTRTVSIAKVAIKKADGRVEEFKGRVDQIRKQFIAKGLEVQKEMSSFEPSQ